MNLQGTNHSKSPLEDILTKKLLLSHDPDGRHLDSEQLLHALENIMLYATLSEGRDLQLDANAEKEVTDIEVVGFEEPLAHTINKISHEILCKCPAEGNLHERTMFLFDLLGNYRWDAKAVLVLAAFAKSYGEFWLLMQLYPRNPLALSVATLKQLPSDLSTFKRRFKALSLLMKTVVDLTKCVIKFECLPLSHVKLNKEAKSITELNIYSAVYWIIRSILTCSYQIRDLKATTPVQYSDSSTIATWELSSLVHRLKGICSHLRQQVEECSQQTESKLFQRLLNIFKEDHNENQEVLRMLFAFRDDFPLIDSSSKAKFGLTELKDKVVIFLISKPGLLTIEESLLLVQQTYDSPHNKILEGSYEIVWIPISESNSWTDAEKKSFRILSHSLPWYSVKQPWSLNSAAVTFIKQAWNYRDDPLMVVLDSRGNVSNLNAIDMVFIWGAKAYPFSDSMEKELWQEQNLTLQLLVDEIDPLLTKWVEEDRCICIYGSDSTDWILELNSKVKEIRNSGVQLEMVYVGTRNPSEHVKNNIISLLQERNPRSQFSLSLTKMRFFWLRLESIIRSKLRVGYLVETDHVLREASSLVDMNDDGKSWVVMGKGSSNDIVRVEGSKFMECLNNFLGWEKDVGKLGFLGAFRIALERAEPCGHFKVIRYGEEEEEEAEKDMEVCEKCGLPVKKFVIYK
ncbi:Sieve element occlusion [Parasponia andersonii]|uniref:Sieve element occlusion n=1 Tax=Parasponia andersonii TaxID=3476 RepID=A0A2P5B0J5_PARAD|nr:Sieve element occlusion [Parasponia andersonii]